MKKIQRLLLLLPMLGLAACGSANEETQTMDPDFPMLTDTRPEEEETAVFKTLNGERVEYNKNTRKIVCIFGSPDVVSFGIKVLAYEKTTETKGFESLYGDAVPLTMNYSAEEVLSYHPELILVNQAMSQTQRETFSKIAPVIPLYNDSDDVSVRLNYIGEIFGLEESATKLISYAETLQQKTIDEINSWGLGGKTLTVFTYMGGITIPPSRNFFFATILYDYLKFERLQIVKDFMEDDSILAYPAISAEVLKDYEGDMVIFASMGDKSISTYVSENVGWKSLDAVKENRVGVINLDNFAYKGVNLLYEQYKEIKEAVQIAGQVK